MTRSERGYEPHLIISEECLQPGTDWMPGSVGWTVIQAAAGGGYWMDGRQNMELPPGTVMLVAMPLRGSIRSSQLGRFSIRHYSVKPERLGGLVSFEERTFFESAQFQAKLSLQIFPADSAVAVRLTEICGGMADSGLGVRLKLVQLFVDMFAAEFKPGAKAVECPSDAKARLCEYLKQTPAADLLHMDFGKLAEMTQCTPRHLSRIFREVVGMSYRDKHAELRLERACELLATTQSKVVDVALESGYHSLSLFNLMFARRFGISPGRWRRKYHGRKAMWPRERRKLAVEMA